MKRGFILFLVVVTVAATAPRATADRAAIFVGGDVKTKERTELTAAAKSIAETSGWGAVTPIVTSTASACIDATDRAKCIPKLVTGIKVEQVIVFQVSAEEHGAGIMKVVTGWMFKPDGELVVADRRFCEQCTSDKLIAVVKELVSAMILRARVPAKLAILSMPTGAMAYVDDVAIGATDLDYSVYAGLHVVRVERLGYETVTRTVTLTEGETMTMEFPLRKIATAPAPDRPAPTPRPGPEPPPPESTSTTIVPWVLIGGGGALVATGGVLFAMEGTEIENGERVPKRRETTIEAVVTTSAGAIAAAVGVYLLLWPPDTATKSETRGPVITIQSGGAWFGYRGTF